MRDALVAGLTLDTFNRHADKVVMANPAQVVNCLQSLFLAVGDRFVATPSCHVFDLYAAHQGAQAVRAEFAAPPVRYARAGQPASFWGLSGSASLDGRSLTLTVVNPHSGEPREADLRVRGARVASCRARVLAAGDVHAHNTFDNPREVEPKSAEVRVGPSGVVVFRFPAASVTALRLDLG
jgi:alpha-N-arabinofuranosidase